MMCSLWQHYSSCLTSFFPTYPSANNNKKQIRHPFLTQHRTNSSAYVVNILDLTYGSSLVKRDVPTTPGALIYSRLSTPSRTPLMIFMLHKTVLVSKSIHVQIATRLPVDWKFCPSPLMIWIEPRK